MGDINLFKFDEDSSTTKTTADDAGIFLGRKSILHYKDEKFNRKFYDSLENKLKKHYEGRKDIEIEFKSLNGYRSLEIIFTINFKKEDDYYQITEDFKDGFKELLFRYQNIN